jgi:hypothetical protein
MKTGTTQYTNIYIVTVKRAQSGMMELCSTVMPLCGTGTTDIKFHNQTPQVVETLDEHYSEWLMPDATLPQLALPPIFPLTCHTITPLDILCIIYYM